MNSKDEKQTAGVYLGRLFMELFRRALYCAEDIPARWLS